MKPVKIVNLPTELLRTFVSVFDLGGYTRAGEAVNRSQPAISLQMQRLENLLGSKLVERDGRALKFTESGRMLAVYARQILRINDDAIAQFHKQDAKGTLRIGLPTDFAVAFLQSTLTQFIRANPGVDLEINCDLSRSLCRAISEESADLAVSIVAEHDSQFLVKSWQVQPVWVAGDEISINDRQQIALLCHPEGCRYRERMVEALERAGKAWRIAYTSPDIAGLQSAVESGLGVTALTQQTLRPGMRVLTETDGYPPMKRIEVGLFYKHPRLTPAGHSLAEHLLSALDRATADQALL